MSARTRAAALLLAVAAALTPSLGLGHDGIDARTDRFRAEHGRRELRSPDWLHDLARARARALWRLGFYHAFYWVPSRCGSGGENLAYREPPPERPGRYFFRAWRGSDPHRRNMLRRGCDVTASHAWVAPDGRMYAVQLFCDLR